MATRSPRSTPRAPQHVGEPVGDVLQLAPVDLADVACEVLVDHRELLARMAVADVGGDVVALGDLPAVLCAGLLVGGEGGCGAHRGIIADLMSCGGDSSGAS